MSELKYYKLSGKIDLLKLSIYFFVALLASYLIGLFYFKTSELVHYFISEKLLKIDVSFEKISFEKIQDKLGFIVAKLMSHGGKGGKAVLLVLCLIPLVLLLVILLLFLPFTVTFFLLAGLTHYLREKGKSRNRIIDSVMFLILLFICFIVSNQYKIDSISNYFELAIFLILGYSFSQSSTNYFCEKCIKNYIKSEFYTTSELNSNDYLEDVIKEGIGDEKRFEEKIILEKEDIENLYYVELNKCDTCGSQIVKIESKIIEVDSDGKKKIKDGNKITEDLLIS